MQIHHPTIARFDPPFLFVRFNILLSYSLEGLIEISCGKVSLARFLKNWVQLQVAHVVRCVLQLTESSVVEK